MATWVWVLIATAVVVVAVLLVVISFRERRTAMLRRQFGAEYDRVLNSDDGRRAAEADLRERERKRAELNVTSLPEPARERFAVEWHGIQERFVDQPSATVASADALVYRVMAARGYPMDDFDAQANLISVDHPDLVERYRLAHGVRNRAQTQQATTEDLRSALLHYRALFDELLKPADDRERFVRPDGR
jgi:hypothetical protein